MTNTPLLARPKLIIVIKSCLLVLYYKHAYLHGVQRNILSHGEVYCIPTFGTFLVGNSLHVQSSHSTGTVAHYMFIHSRSLNVLPCAIKSTQGKKRPGKLCGVSLGYKASLLGSVLDRHFSYDLT